MTTFKEFLDETVHVQDSNYEFANGTKPKGHGTWMFSKHKNHDVRKHPKEDMFSHTGNYSEAKSEAKKHFNKLGHVGDIHTQT